ncbi:MAG: TGS domain-containing protein, partial [Pirellulaceae bacterium]|nr:TGS domain-containing protein [Pirellulaceae bacterium]
MSPMLTVGLPDGSEKQFDQVVTAGDVAADIGPGLAKAALAAEIDGTIVGLDVPLPEEGQVALLQGQAGHGGGLQKL